MHICVLLDLTERNELNSASFNYVTQLVRNVFTKTGLSHFWSTDFFFITRSFKTLRLQKLGFFQILRNLWLSKWWIVQVNPPGYEWTANESAIKSASVSSIICKCNFWTSRYPSNLQDNQLFFNILPCSFSFLLLPSLHETLHEPRWEYIDLLPG